MRRPEVGLIGLFFELLVKPLHSNAATSVSMNLKLYWSFRLPSALLGRSEGCKATREDEFHSSKEIHALLVHGGLDKKNDRKGDQSAQLAQCEP